MTMTRDFLETTMSVSDVAERAGVSSNAVRYYERYGVITSYRTSGNARRFTIDAVCRIKLAKGGQRVGLTLKECAGFLAEIPPHSENLDLWRRAGRQLVDEGKRRIAELEDAVDEFSSPDFMRS